MAIVNNSSHRANFNWIAPFYQRLQSLVFGQHLVNAQIHFFSTIKPQSNVLVIGGGSGEFLPALVSRKPNRITYVDASNAMIDMARENIGNYKAVEWVAKDIFDWRPQERYDVVLAPFVMDLFSTYELEILLNQLKPFLQAEANIILTDFHYTNKWWHKQLIQVMILFFRLTAKISTSRLPNYQHAFGLNGFTKRFENMWLGGLVRSSVYSIR